MNTSRKNATCVQHRPIKVLVSSASKKAPLINAMQIAAKRICSSAKVVAGDLDRQAISAFVADEFWSMPPTNENSVETIIEGCVRRGITCVLPTRDGELLFWARHLREFKMAGISVIVSPVDSLKVNLDKLEFSLFGAKYGLPFILSTESPDELDDVANWVVKERFGAGSRSIGVKLDRSAAIAHARQLEIPIYQPYIDGTEISIDAWLDQKHHVKGVVLRRRDLVMNGESLVTSTFRDPHIEAETTRILELLHLSGPVVMQAIIDAQGNMHVIECNARFGGASTASITAGLDSLYWSLLEIEGNIIANYPFLRVPEEIRQIRISKDIHVCHSDF
ncbi:MAG: hypothetical protein BA869_11110 [Desulfuromonadales bacterium C00003107]|jgi:carbamoyl-phosphate synthase large subunit|nr:MAG: hypothetical protein BA869_11110 [Desulfuromonadales bacterium C00003107]